MVFRDITFALDPLGRGCSFRFTRGQRCIQMPYGADELVCVFPLLVSSIPHTPSGCVPALWCVCVCHFALPLSAFSKVPTVSHPFKCCKGLKAGLPWEAPSILSPWASPSNPSCFHFYKLIFLHSHLNPSKVSTTLRIIPLPK